MAKENDGLLRVDYLNSVAEARLSINIPPLPKQLMEASVYILIGATPLSLSMPTLKRLLFVTSGGGATLNGGKYST